MKTNMPQKPTKTTQAREEDALDIIRAHGGELTLAELVASKGVKYVQVPREEKRTRLHWVREEATMTERQARYIIGLLKKKGKIKYPVGGNKIKLV